MPRVPAQDVDPHRLAGELPDQRRARLRRDRVQGAPPLQARSSSPATRSSSTSPACRRSAASPGSRSEMFEDRTPIWPQGKKKQPEPYPWRVEAEPVVVLRRGGVRPGRGAGRRARARRASGRASTGTSPSRDSCARSAKPTRALLRERLAARAPAARGERRGRRGAPRAPLLASRRRTRCCRADAAAGQLPEAKDELTDTEAHELLSEAAPLNGGGEAGRQVGVAFLEVRRPAGDARGGGDRRSGTSTAGWSTSPR